MKTKLPYLFLALTLCSGLFSSKAFAQIIDKESLIGTWEIEGTLMGDNGEGWIMPDKHSASDCGKDHTVFNLDETGKEITYATACKTVERIFQWELEGSKLTLSKGERRITWHLLSLEDGQLKVGIQMRPDSERKMYVAYKKQN